jgi:hypothetical protein
LGRVDAAIEGLRPFTKEYFMAGGKELQVIELMGDELCDCALAPCEDLKVLSKISRVTGFVQDQAKCGRLIRIRQEDFDGGRRPWGSG